MDVSLKLLKRFKTEYEMKEREASLYKTQLQNLLKMLSKKKLSKEKKMWAFVKQVSTEFWDGILIFGFFYVRNCILRIETVSSNSMLIVEWLRIFLLHEVKWSTQCSESHITDMEIFVFSEKYTTGIRIR